LNKWLRRLLWSVVILGPIGVPAYIGLVSYSPQAGDSFALDLNQLRAAASEIPGDKPREIRYENVLALTFSEAMLMAGDPWKKTLMQVYSYQLVYPDASTVIIDSAMDRATAQPAFLVDHFDENAYARMSAALGKARQIVITHEHMDHIGGIAAYPDPAGLVPALRLTAEQLANRDGMKPAVLPPAIAGMTPLGYDGIHALAPGVVLIKSPGHTPGSQMVYVQLADGNEFLFLGDVSWRLRNIEQVRERPLFMTLIIGEDRHAVLAEFKAIHRLAGEAPNLHLVPGHEGPAISALQGAGLLQQGFQP
jgi:glyoxylase-like metal-dependent hydrolase (beta-lactamase superfamily II)